MTVGEHRPDTMSICDCENIGTCSIALILTRHLQLRQSCQFSRIHVSHNFGGVASDPLKLLRCHWLQPFQRGVFVYEITWHDPSTPYNSQLPETPAAS